ncbi:MAG: hemerythrin domain-containing protein [Elusimicrobia bacterium]|nr:hemerythrin domain-containing protein [Elusimicrobiota bacterium]
MDLIEKLVAGHRYVVERKDILDKLTEIMSNDDSFWDNTQKIMSFFNTELRGHFALEEKVLFPVLRGVFAAPELAMLETIEKEHGPILAKLEKLKSLPGIHQENPSKKERATIIDACRELLLELCNHAHKEDVQLFPLVRTTLQPSEYHELENLYFKFLGL